MSEFKKWELLKIVCRPSISQDSSVHVHVPPETNNYGHRGESPTRRQSFGHEARFDDPRSESAHPLR